MLTMNDVERKKLLDVNESLQVVNEFRREPSLIELDSVKNVLIMGDTHGDYEVSRKILDRFLKKEDLLVVALGDYVDRGPRQIENVNFLFQKKREYPDKLILLRGNHEWREMNESYGFSNVVKTLFDNDASVYDRYEDVFSEMPVALRIRKPNVLLLHGGIPIDPAGARTITLKEIKKIPKGIKDIFVNGILDQIEWNDPKESLGTFTQSVRGIGYFFGRDVFDEFMTVNQIDLCVRSHEAFDRPKFFFKQKLVSIFSSITYGIVPQFLTIDENLGLKFITL